MILNETSINILIGAAIPIFGTFVQSEFLARRERRVAQDAVIAEIQSILQMIRMRNYRNIFQDALNQLVSTHRFPLGTIEVTQPYFAIYLSAAHNVGRLGSLATKTVSFYHHAFTLLEDFRSFTNTARLVGEDPPLGSDPVVRDNMNRTLTSILRLIDTMNLEGTEILAMHRSGLGFRSYYLEAP